MNHSIAHVLRSNPSIPRLRPLAMLALTALLLVPVESRAQTLPAGWASRNIGSPTLAGRAVYSGGTYTLEGAGADVWGGADQFVYAYQQVTGDVSVMARVTSLEIADDWAKAGVMIRETLSAGSKHAFALVSASHGVALQYRSATNGTTAHASGGSGAAPVWLRVDRRSSTVTAYRSNDGATWTRIASVTISMTSSVYVGLAVTSHDPSQLATATFAGVGVVPLLPSGWSVADVGAPSVKGSVTYGTTSSGAAFTFKAAGTDVWGTSDQFTFAYRQVTGDVDVVTRVWSLQYVHDWTKAGVMIRASLRSDAAHASMFVSAAKGLAFQRRPATGLSSLHTSGGTGAAPVWLKLERRGTAVTAFRSADGVTWKMIGSQTLSLPTTFYVGLAVTSHEPTAAATAVFGNVSVTLPSSSGNTAPTISLTSPGAGATFVAPASIAIAATASDVDGAIARVEFYQGTTLIATDTSSPYSINWANVPAGSYSLTAVAVDNGGASTRSAARGVIVNNPTPPTTAVFAPSADHNTTRVTSYRLDIFTQGANPATAAAMAVQNLGKPAIVSGECRVDIAATINSLPSGYYFATVVAVGPAGTSGRAVSAVFYR